MQRIIHEYRNQSRVFNMLEGLYAYISDHDAFDDILWLDNSFKDICDILDSNILCFNRPLLKEMGVAEIPHRKCDTPESNKEITVCLSGGKDSAACAKYYVDRGYKVHLYHATGINKAYGDEKKAAQAIADYLGCDLFIDKVYGSGTHDWVEHPLKNYMIANGAVHYCLGMNYPVRIAFGNFYQSTLDMNPFDVCGGDCIEMWDAYRKIIQTVIPDFDISIPLATNGDTFEILSQDWKLFSLAVSCMSPFRFRAHWKHRTEEKYNVRLLENRCGCCWKCCIEAMWLMDHDKMDLDETFYFHCFHILERTIRHEQRGYADTVQDIWTNYMCYPITDSKFYDRLVTEKVRCSY